MIMQFDSKHTAQRLKKQQRKTKPNNDMVNYHPIKYQQYDSIKVLNQKGRKLLVQTDVQFVQSIHNVCKSRANIISQLITKSDVYLSDDECEQIHHLGMLHREANKINRNSNLTKNDLRNHEQLRILYCHCGCERIAGKNYAICHDIQELNFLGSGILLFFNLIKGLFISFVPLVVVYSLYAIIQNAKGEYYQTDSPSQTCDSSYCKFKDRVSIYNLVDTNYVLDILNWMGLATMIIWILFSRFLKYYCFYKDKLIDDNLKSSSDFAVKIDNLPCGEYNQEDLYQFLEQIYQRKIANLEKVEPNRVLQTILNGNAQQQILPQNSSIDPNLPFVGDEFSKRVMGQLRQKFQDVVEKKFNRENHFNIRSIQIIYRMDFSRKIIQKIVDQCQTLSDYIKQSEGKHFITDKEKYIGMKRDTIEIYETLADLRKKFLNDGNFRKKIATRSAIIQFQDQKDKGLLLDNFGQKNLTLFKRIKEILNHWINGTSSLIFKGQIPVISRSPEPSDILWQNCQKQFSYLRLFGIFCATTLVILVSLGAIAGLQALQFYLKEHTSSIQQESSISMKVFNFMTSIVLIIINAILWVLLNFLLDYEYNHTYTEKIISQMNKSSPAMWINTIIIPIVVNYVFYDRYYGADGVAGIVFDYQVTALAVSLPLMVINPLQLIVSACLKIKCLRNYLIRSRYHKKNVQQDEQINKIMMEKIYKLYSSPQFVIEEAYIFILSNVMHALFFCQLQPFILILVGLQIFFFYWACKVRVLRLCTMPALIDGLVFEVAIYKMMMAPIFYGVGCLYNSYVSSKLDETVSFNFVASSICVGIGVFNYFNPGDLVNKLVQKIADCFECLKKENVFKDQREKKKEDEERKLKQERKKSQEKLNQSVNQRLESKQILQEIIHIEKKHLESLRQDLNIENVRLENYYKNNNCLTLLGYQRAILGEASTKETELQFKNFCESHIQRTIPSVQLFETNSMEEKERSQIQIYQQIEIHQQSSAVIIQ